MSGEEAMKAANRYHALIRRDTSVPGPNTKHGTEHLVGKTPDIVIFYREDRSSPARQRRGLEMEVMIFECARFKPEKTRYLGLFNHDIRSLADIEQVGLHEDWRLDIPSGKGRRQSYLKVPCAEADAGLLLHLADAGFVNRGITVFPSATRKCVVTGPGILFTLGPAQQEDAIGWRQTANDCNSCHWLSRLLEAVI